MRSSSGLWAMLRGTAAYGLGPLVGLATAPILARALGVDGRGQLAAVLQPLSVADAIAAFGFPAAATYFTARGFAARGVATKTGLLALATSVATYLALIPFALRVSHNQGIHAGALLALWTCVVPGALIAVARGTIAGKRQWALLDGERSGLALTRLASIIGVAWTGVTSALAFATLPIVSALLLSSLIFVAKRRLMDSTAHQLEPPQTRSIISYAGHASVATIAFAANSRLDQAILPLVSDSRSNGLYAVAATIAELSIIVGAVAQRKVTSDFASNETTKVMSRDIRRFAVLAVAAVILTVLVVAPLTPLIFGNDFAAAADLARILAIGTLGTSTLMVCHAINAGSGRPSRSAPAVMLSVVATFAYVALVGTDTNVTELAWVVSISQLLAGAVALAMAVPPWRERSWVGSDSPRQ